jgi:hypothetical protein
MLGAIADDFVLGMMGGMEVIYAKSEQTAVFWYKKTSRTQFERPGDQY